MALIVAHLPPGSQIAKCNVARAYRTIPLDPSQWPSTVVWLDDNNVFIINTRNCFGLASANGVWGLLADALCNIFCVLGIGPKSKWVDDFIIFWLLVGALADYNAKHALWAAQIHCHDGQQWDHARLWYQGDLSVVDVPTEYDKDCTTTLLDLSGALPYLVEDASFAYADCDISTVSAAVQVPWAIDKGTLFAFCATYMGISWDLPSVCVGIPADKQVKYLAAILAFQQHQVLVL